MALAREHNLSHLEVLVDYCLKNDIENDRVRRLMSRELKAIIDEDGRKLFLIKDE
jgi:hypothetical protein